MESIVREVHADLKALQSECQANRENPRLLRIIDALLRLTDSDGSYQDEQAETQEQAKVTAMPARVEKPQPQDCPHDNINVYGVCRGCGAEFDANGQPKA